MTTCSRQAERNLERVVDKPLERSERADHEDTRGQPVPQPAEADVAVDPGDGLPGALAGFAVAVELGDHDIWHNVSTLTRYSTWARGVLDLPAG